MVTTVKLQEKTKLELDYFRKEKESYDVIISKLVGIAKQKEMKKRLEEAYKKMGKEQLDVLEEWEPASYE